MKAGIINDDKRIVIPGFRDRLTLYNFTISMVELDLLKIPHSAFSTPARYIMELYRRLRSIKDDSEGDCFVFNPLFELGGAIVFHVISELARLRGEIQGAAIISDGNNTPLGYLLPASLAESDVKYLSLLSTVDAKTDEEFLRDFLQLSVKSITVEKARFDRSLTNKFCSSNDFFKIYSWTTVNALETLKRNEIAIPEAELGDRKKIRDAIPFALVMPYQAGDVLFICLAYDNIKTHFEKIVINKAYLDILTENAPGLKPIISTLKLPMRGGNDLTDELYFKDLEKELPQGNLYYFCRPCRNYNIAKFHLIDQFAFALGERFIDKSDLVTRKKNAPKTFRPDNGGVRRVLMHFDGGWALKRYPVELQKKLIEMFCSEGYDVTVFGDRDAVFACEKNVRFKDLAHLRELLWMHNFMIGMDSFPSHYAAHVIGIPTICLYSSTRPENSDATISENYTYMEKGFDCRPCPALDVCQKTKGTVCANFAEPGKVFERAVSMMDNIDRRMRNE